MAVIDDGQQTHRFRVVVDRYPNPPFEQEVRVVVHEQFFGAIILGRYVGFWRRIEVFPTGMDYYGHSLFFGEKEWAVKEAEECRRSLWRGPVTKDWTPTKFAMKGHD